MGSVTIGADIGQRVDPTAIAVVEREGERFIVRHLERLPLGTNYPKVAARIGEVYRGALVRVIATNERYRDDQLDEIRGSLDTEMQGSRERAKSDVWLLVDATGVGTPVVDILREQPDLSGANLTACFFTSSDKTTIRPHAREASIGKAYLVSRLQALIQTKRIVLPKTAQARALADELLDYEIRVTDDANMTAGAFKTGAHDDMVTALGLAVIYEEGRTTCGSIRYA